MKLFFLITSFFGFSILSTAQKGNNLVGISLDAGIPLGDFGDFAQVGPGGVVRGLYGIGTAGHVTLTTGYSYFRWKDLISGEDANSHIIPVLIGYRQNFSAFFVEPYLGYANYGEKYSYLNNTSSASVGSFAWGGGLGWGRSGFEGGARFLGLTKQGTLSTVFIYIGYDLPLGK